MTFILFCSGDHLFYDPQKKKTTTVFQNFIVTVRKKKQFPNLEVMESILEHRTAVQTHVPEIPWAVNICFNGVHSILWPVGPTPHLGIGIEKGK